MNTKQLIADLKQLENSNWWKQLQSYLQDGIEKLEDEILWNDWIDPYNNEVRFTQLDLIRSQRSSYKELLKLPSTLGSQLDAVETLDLD